MKTGEFLLALFVIFTIGCGIITLCFVAVNYPEFGYEKRYTVVTCEYKWEDSANFYFIDENDITYKLHSVGDIQDMAQRYERLVVGDSYFITYYNTLVTRQRVVISERRVN